MKDAIQKAEKIQSRETVRSGNKNTKKETDVVEDAQFSELVEFPRDYAIKYMISA